jgi:ribosomal protein S18 acetylase RimI-like enzyme
VFRDILLRSHEESLDCPELNLLRTADEVLAGYLECASELSTWWLAYLVDEPVGVLLMLRNELTFVGVVPERRQQGIGRALLESAVELTRPLTLIVDARNAPALQLYSSVGFAIVGAREVFLKTNF